MFLENSLAFQDEEAAYRYVENHVWPEGAVCPRCESSRRTSRLTGKSTRIGTYKCYECRKPFTVKIGTLFQQSHLPMHIWLKTIFLLSCTRREINIERLCRVLEITPRSAASMAKRIESWRQCRHKIQREVGKIAGTAKSGLRIDGIQGANSRKERQFRNFIEAVRELECDQIQQFKQALTHLLPVKRGHREENAAHVADLRSGPLRRARLSPVQRSASISFSRAGLPAWRRGGEGPADHRVLAVVRPATDGDM